MTKILFRCVETDTSGHDINSSEERKENFTLAIIDFAYYRNQLSCLLCKCILFINIFGVGVFYWFNSCITKG